MSVSFDYAVKTEIIRRLSEMLREYYIFPDVAEEICTRLEKALADGDYREYHDGALFALALTMHLQEVSHDEHLWVRWHPQPLPGKTSILRENQAWQDERRGEAKLDNYGLYKVERLPGNVGYLDIRYFHRPAWGGETVSAAMAFLANVEALIFDLRKCLGGYPGMVALISGYLFGEESIHLDSIYWRDEDLTQQYWTPAFVQGKRFEHQPVYVLISKETFSAGEAFAYNLKSLGRATLIGERTEGGAHPGAAYRLHPQFEAFIPIGRTINPITNLNWEKEGVLPDVNSPPGQALQVAHRLALESILQKGENPESGLYPQLLEEAKEALKDL